MDYFNFKGVASRLYYKNQSAMPISKVAVIGAGPAGLCALRHMLGSSYNGILSPIAFERNARIGGVWLYTNDTNKVPLHSAVYDNMRTNLPKEIMPYEKFPFPDELPSYIHHSDFLKYLEDFADHFELKPYIRLSTEVKKVTPIKKKSSDSTVWEVTTKNMLSGEETTDQFDAVLVCNGHYSVPNCTVPGLSNFKGNVIHSQKYREPSLFQSQSILVVGSASSGIDIGLEIASSAKKVYLSCRRERRPVSAAHLPANIALVLGTSRVSDDGRVVLDDGSTLDVDAIVLCTGYEYDFPFLSSECGITVDDHRVKSVYKHLFNIRHPSMAFIGLNFTIVPLVHFDVQVKFVLATFTGSVVLPDTNAMLADEEKDFRDRLHCGLLPRDAHWLGGGRQWRYLEELADIGSFESGPKIWEDIYNQNSRNKGEFVSTYKNLNCVILDPERRLFQFM